MEGKDTTSEEENLLCPVNLCLAFCFDCTALSSPKTNTQTNLGQVSS